MVPKYWMFLLCQATNYQKDKKLSFFAGIFVVIIDFAYCYR